MISIETIAPGPGAYDNSKAQLVKMSRVRDHRSFRIGKVKRDHYIQAKYKAMNFPGAGTYEYLSDFPKPIRNMGTFYGSNGSRMAKTSRSGYGQKSEAGSTMSLKNKIQ